MNITHNIKEIIDTIPSQVKLVAVSKTKPKEYIQEAYDGGYRIFGENKPQELKEKYNDLPKDIEWHFIGHLQTNKVKYIAPFVSLIHAVDSMKLLQEINKQAIKNDRVIDCLLQFHIAKESSKFGFTQESFHDNILAHELFSLQGVRIIGVMGMATFTDNTQQVEEEFKNLKQIFDNLEKDFFIGKDFFKEISMGMSGDYKIAINQGSNMIRVGSYIFGER